MMNRRTFNKALVAFAALLSIPLSLEPVIPEGLIAVDSIHDLYKRVDGEWKVIETVTYTQNL